MNTRTRTLLTAGALAAPAAGILLAPTAGAAELPDNAATVGDIVGAVDFGILPALPPLPTLPAPVIPDGGVLPANLLRTSDAKSDPDAVVATRTAPAAGPDPDTLNHKVTAAQILADPDSRDNLIGQAVGTLTPPTGDQIGQIRDNLGHLVDNVTSGAALRDVQQTFDDFLASDSYTTWRDNTDNPFAPREGRGVERAAAGIDALIDSATRRPVETAQQIVAEAGGPVRLLTDPVGATRDVLTKIAGPDFVADLTSWFTDDLIPDLRDTLSEALPALLIPLATGALAAVPGLIGSVLASLPAALGLPMLGSSAGSALALVALATLTYGVWLLSEIPVVLLSGVVGLALGVVVGLGLWALSGFNPVMGIAAVGAGILTALFVFTMGVLGYTLATFLIPTIAFLLLAPLFIGVGGGLGGLLGGLLGTALAAVIIPVGTGVSALTGALAGLLPALVIFAVIAFTRFAGRAGEWGDGPLGRVLDAINRGWESSSTRHIFDDLQDIWDRTDTGRTLGDLNALLNSLASTASFLDGEALRDLLVSGFVAGAVPGLLLSLGEGLLAGLGTAALTYLPNLLLVAGPWLAVAAISLIGALASALIPPLAIATAAWIIGSLALSSPLWVPLTLVATVLTLVAFAGSNPAVVLATGGASGAVAGIAGAVGAALAILDLVVILGALALGLPTIGLGTFLLTLPLFTFGALASQIPALLSLPFPFIVAAGMSLLEATLVGTAVTGITAPVNVAVGGTLGAVLALLSSLRADVYNDGGTWVFDGRIENSTLPTVRDFAVPEAASAGYATGIPDTRDRSLTDITALVGA